MCGPAHSGRGAPCTGMIDRLVHHDAAEGVRRLRSCPVSLDIALWRQMKELWGIKIATLKGRQRTPAAPALDFGDGALPPARKRPREG